MRKYLRGGITNRKTKISVFRGNAKVLKLEQTKRYNKSTSM